MVDKFPSLTDSEQRIFSLDVARFASTEHAGEGLAEAVTPFSDLWWQTPAPSQVIA